MGRQTEADHVMTSPMFKHRGWKYGWMKLIFNLRVMARPALKSMNVTMVNTTGTDFNLCHS